MIEFIQKLENIKIKEYNDDKFTEPIGSLKCFEATVKQVDLVQDFLLFKVIYENSRGNIQEIRFNIANYKLEEIKNYSKQKKNQILTKYINKIKKF